MTLRILVPTSGPEPAKRNALRLTKMAKSFDAELIIVHIRDQGEDITEGDQALDIFDRVCIQENVRHSLVRAVGEVSSTIIGQARFNNVDLIIMGATEGRAVAGWIIDRIMANIDIPVLILPWASK